MEISNLLLSGEGFGVVKSFFLALLLLKDLYADEYVKTKVDEYLESKKLGKDKKRVKDFVTLAFNDKFPIATLTRVKNDSLLSRLETLRKKMLDLYFSTLKELTQKDDEFNRVYDVDVTLVNYVIQLMRLRSVIQPNIAISKSIHPKTNIAYLAAKSYWINDDNIQERKFTKSLGRADSYPLGIKDPKAYEDGLNLIQEAMYNLYVDLYPD